MAIWCSLVISRTIFIKTTKPMAKYLWKFDCLREVTHTSSTWCLVVCSWSWNLVGSKSDVVLSWKRTRRGTGRCTGRCLGASGAVSVPDCTHRMQEQCPCSIWWGASGAHQACPRAPDAKASVRWPSSGDMPICNPLCAWVRWSPDALLTVLNAQI